ncbi:MAG: hypothetical protein H6727_10495 [Myxococcales bacterium]|nr:hypothetical protein [Myxococcales bacterium]
MSTKRPQIFILLLCISLPFFFISMQSHANPPQWQQADDDEESERSLPDAGAKPDAEEPSKKEPSNQEPSDAADAGAAKDKDAPAEDDAATDAGPLPEKKDAIKEDVIRESGKEKSLPDATISPDGKEKVAPPAVGTKAPPTTGEKQPPKGAGATTSPTFGGEAWKDVAQQSMTWQFRWLALILGLLLLSFAFLLLHVLLPLRALRFLGGISNFFLILSWLSVGGLFLWRVLWIGRWSIGSFFDDMLWFSFGALTLYLWHRKGFAKVYISHALLTIVTFGALTWAGLTNLYPAYGGFSLLTQQGPFYTLAWTLGYLSLGGLSVAASWCLASGFLGLLARGHHGTGYGLVPEDWQTYQQQTAHLVKLVFPWMTASVFLFFVWSIERFGSPWAGLAWKDGRAWSIWIGWLLLGATLLSLRIPVELEKEGEAWEGIRARKLPSFLLLVTAFVTAALYVGAPQWLLWLQK